MVYVLRHWYWYMLQTSTFFFTIEIISTILLSYQRDCCQDGLLGVQGNTQLSAYTECWNWEGFAITRKEPVRNGKTQASKFKKKKTKNRPGANSHSGHESVSKVTGLEHSLSFSWKQECLTSNTRSRHKRERAGRNQTRKKARFHT